MLFFKFGNDLVTAATIRAPYARWTARVVAMGIHCNSDRLFGSFNFVRHRQVRYCTL